MAAVEYDIEIEQGSDWAYQWPVNDGGTPLDLTGWTVRGQVRSRHSSPDVLHEWSTTLGNATVASGSFTLSVAASASSAWTWKKGVYDIELVSPEGTVYRVLQGEIEVDPEVTR